MRPLDFMRQMVSSETDRRMEMRYGNLEANVMDEAKDVALSETNINLLHDQLMAAAMQAGKTVADKAAMNLAADNAIKDQRAYGVSSYRLMQDMGRAAKQAQQALLNGDFATATQALQRQTLSAMIAQRAVAIEKAVAKFDKFAKQNAKRERDSVMPENMNYVHQILTQVGKKIKRGPEDLQREIDASDSKSLGDFVQRANDNLRPVTVWEQLFDKAWTKPFKELTVQEFGLVNDSLRSLVSDGQLEKKLIAQGKEYDFNTVRDKLVDAVSKLPFKSMEQQEARTLFQRVPQGFLARAKQMETVFGRWDRFDQYGDWTQKVLRDLIDGANQSDVWKQEFANRLVEAIDDADLNKPIDNKLIRAPMESGGHYIQMNRGGLRAVMLNMGNESNIFKFTKGWQIERPTLEAWVRSVADKKDWVFTQKIWDIFKDAKERNDIMMRSIGAVPAQSIEARPIMTEFGTFNGGYYPAIRHNSYGGVPYTPLKDSLRGAGFESVEPPDRFKIERTKAVYPMALDLNQMPNRLSQIIHDTAIRPAVLNAAKVFNDPKILAAVRTHAGVDFADQFKPYLKGVANSANTGEIAWKAGEEFSTFMRRNLMSGLIGYNPGTFLKHGFTAAGLSMKEVGPEYMDKGVKALFTINDETGESNYKFIMENVLDLQRRHRNALETLHGATGELSPMQRAELGGLNVSKPLGKAMKMREFILENSGKPIAFSDWLSSVPTAMGAYLKAMDQGRDVGDALWEAGRAVRRAHGSTAVTNRPMIMQQGNPWLTTFYTFFNDVHNRQAETLWRAGDALKLTKDGDKAAAMKQWGAVAAGTFAYMIYPALVESWVAPMPHDPEDSWYKRALKQQAFTEGATLPIVRDLVNGLLDAQNPNVGLITTELKQMTDLFRDYGKEEPFSPAHAEKMIRDAGGLVGVLTGIPQQLAKELSAAYGVATGHERPRGPWGWLVLGRYGTLKGHSQTAGDYLAGRYDRSK
jgi:hypothetical protein